MPEPLRRTNLVSVEYQWKQDAIEKLHRSGEMQPLRDVLWAMSHETREAFLKWEAGAVGQRCAYTDILLDDGEARQLRERLAAAFLAGVWAAQERREQEHRLK